MRFIDGIAGQLRVKRGASVACRNDVDCFSCFAVGCENNLIRGYYDTPLKSKVTLSAEFDIIEISEIII